MKTCVSGLNALFRRTKDVKHPFNSIWPKMIYVTVTEHFTNLVHVKTWKLVFRAWMHYFGVPKLRSIHSSPLDRKWYKWVLRSTLLTLCTYKYEKLCFVPECTILEYQSCEDAFAKKRPFYSIRPKMMFGSVLEHFNNLLHVKRCKTCVLSMNALFRGTNVAKHPFYSIGPKMIYRNVTEHFANLLHVNRCKTYVSGLNAVFWVPKLSKWFRNKSIHSTPLYRKWCLGVFQNISIIVCTLKDAKLVFQVWMHYLGAPM
jgi:hypothetical protein